jgi:hypothetical protein
MAVAVAVAAARAGPHLEYNRIEGVLGLQMRDAACPEAAGPHHAGALTLQ